MFERVEIEIMFSDSFNWLRAEPNAPHFVSKQRMSLNKRKSCYLGTKQTALFIFRLKRVVTNRGWQREESSSPWKTDHVAIAMCKYKYYVFNTLQAGKLHNQYLFKTKSWIRISLKIFLLVVTFRLVR